MRRRTIHAAGLLIATAVTAAAEFVPGRIYTSGIAGPSQQDPSIPGDAIFEFDPITGQSREFARLPFGLTGSMTGLAFTPDGTRLRVSAYYANSIVEFDGDGNVTVALDFDDEIVAPYGGNNIGYGLNGDFFAASGLQIQRFSASGGASEVIADRFDAPMGPDMSIALGPDGSLYYEGTSSPSALYRIDASGNVGLFDTLPAEHPALALTVDSVGTLFAMARGAMYRYPNGDPTARELISEFGPSGYSSIAMSADESMIIISANNGVYGMDAVSGEWTTLGSIPSPWDYITGHGVAVHVPELSSSVALGILCASFVRHSRRR